jgi:hypothetical protein
LKKLILVGLALSLSGCGDSAPDTGDIKDYLADQSSSCQHLLVTNVKKTNGYQDEDRYRVDFEFSIKTKDQNLLKELRKTYLQDQVTEEENKELNRVRGDQVAALASEIIALEKEDARTRPMPSTYERRNRNPYGSALTTEQMAQYYADVDEWRANTPQNLIAKRAELETLKSAPMKYGEIKKYSIQNTVQAGCSYSFRDTSISFASNAINAVEGRNEAWLGKQEVDMTGFVRMRKTENGWKAL